MEIERSKRIVGISLSKEAERLVAEKIRSGSCSSADEVVLAGLGSLERDELFGHHAADERDRLLAEGKIGKADGGVDTAEAIARLRRRLSASGE